MIWPRWLNNQPAHRWLREIVAGVTKGFGVKLEHASRRHQWPREQERPGVAFGP